MLKIVKFRRYGPRPIGPTNKYDTNHLAYVKKEKIKIKIKTPIFQVLWDIPNFFPRMISYSSPEFARISQF